ncbi:MAG: sulfur carrier protein ThiS [Lentimicrobiaceae bacterium]|jgi:thiamine biosynthesis protein ThiS|nr:sulfur carrier protein ThiS [Lentimicrobiaceae bacterium]
MTITLNGQTENFPANEMSIMELLQTKKINWKLLIVKHNGRYIKRAAYEATVLREGDDIMVLSLMDGG